ncbi:MAG: [protein-PII] uridylyltransferase [Puniceicoccaceae bacterium]
MKTLTDPLFRRVRAHAESRIRFSGDLPSRADRTEAYRTFFSLEQKMLERYHRKGDSGLRVAKACAIVIDVLLCEIFDAAGEVLRPGFPGLAEKIALVALGGYGRGEMCPYSDVDVLLLYPDGKETARLAQFQKAFAEEMLYPLWDLGLKVGHASRTVRQALEEAEAEPKSKNALLESRFICGDPALLRRFLRKFRPLYHNRNPEDYIVRQIELQRERRKKYGDSIYMQEPDIKNGVGGLRDFQNALWMDRIKFDGGHLESLCRHGVLSEDRSAQFLDAYDFLLRVRNELHFLARRATDLLSLDRQPVIAENLGYRQEDPFVRVEAFMRDYYAAAKTILRTAHLVEERIVRRNMPIRSDRFCLREAIEARRHQPVRQIDGFTLANGVLSAAKPSVFEEDPVRLLRVFRLAQQHRACLHIDLEERIEESRHLLVVTDPWPEPLRKCFRAILQEAGHVFPILERMHALGVLGHLIPEFGRLTCLVQHEFYHRYTADIHTLDTIRHLDEIFQRTDPPFPSYLAAIRRTDFPTLLYLILLLHDIGKADGIRGHDHRGAVLAKPVLNRMGIAAPQQRQILFIIENHLEMARFSQRFDLNDPATIQSFADITGQESQLCYLYAHTYCDARGTAESLWNSYKQSLHEALYRRTLRVLADGRDPEEEERRRRRMIEKDLFDRPIARDLSRDELEAHFNLLPDRYFAHNSIDEVETHLRMIHQLLARIQTADSVGALAPVIDWQNNREQGLTVVNVVTWDRAGLFYKLAGALSVCGLNILSTKAITRTDHIAIDTFYVTGPSGGAVEDDKVEKRFEASVREALVEGRDLLEAIEREAQRQESNLFGKGAGHLPIRIEPVVNVYHELSLKRTIIEVQAPDSLGLLYRLSKIITAHDFDITFARIATENGVANDTFYIEGIERDGVIENENLLQLRQALSEAVSPSPAASAASDS